MKIALCEHMCYDDMSALETTISRLCPQRYRQAIQYENPFMRWMCLKTFAMLVTLLRDEGVFLRTPLTLEYNVYGKPHIVGVDYQFSISHCKKALLVAIDDKPIGVDIEDLSRRVNPRLYTKVLSPSECECVHSSQDFLALWTRKEALLKYRGIGLQRVSLLPHLLTCELEVELVTVPVPTKGYVFTIAKGMDNLIE